MIELPSYAVDVFSIPVPSWDNPKANKSSAQKSPLSAFSGSYGTVKCVCYILYQATPCLDDMQ